MNDITVNLESDFKSNVISSATIMGASLDPHLPSLARERLNCEVKSLTDDSNSERVFLSSFNERAFSFEALLSHDDEEVYRTEDLMSHPILTEGEIHAAKSRKGFVNHFVQVY